MFKRILSFSAPPPSSSQLLLRQQLHQYQLKQKSLLFIPFKRFIHTHSTTMVQANKSFIVNRTSLRTSNPKSIDFWTGKLGMSLIKTHQAEDAKTTSYFLNYPQPEDEGKDVTARSGVLELVYVSDATTSTTTTTKINNGNGETDRGFGHVCISVDNIEVAEKKFLDAGVRFKKKLSEGRQHDIAFLLSDYDDYWVELIENGIDKKEGESNIASYRLNHSMIRVVEIEKSLKFYRDLGLKLFKRLDFEGAKFSLYFLGYNHDPNFEEGSLSFKELSKYQSLIELTYNWENEEGFKGYNLGEQGFRNIVIAGDTITEQKTIEDPDSYKVELSTL